MSLFGAAKEDEMGRFFVARWDGKKGEKGRELGGGFLVPDWGTFS